jgi:hypothetical protein
MPDSFHSLKRLSVVAFWNIERLSCLILDVLKGTSEKLHTFPGHHMHPPQSISLHHVWSTRLRLHKMCAEASERALSCSRLKAGMARRVALPRSSVYAEMAQKGQGDS